MSWFLRLLAAVGFGLACSVLTGGLVHRLFVKCVLRLEPFDGYILVYGLPAALGGLCAYRLAGWLFQRANRPIDDDGDHRRPCNDQEVLR